jgi:8-oxo-dGTP diphosphatase
MVCHHLRLFERAVVQEVCCNPRGAEGVVREVKEEVGLTIKPKRIIDISSKPLHREIVLTFLCSVVRGKPTLSDEADEIAFFSLPELPEKISLRQRERVEDFFSKSR